MNRSASCCVIAEWYKFGIEPNFGGGDEADGTRDVLRLPWVTG